ncbi:MAG: GTPase HflX [Rhodospirillaceae bacterium]|nr:GTPase HflX [Rhodospirillaceae bacterium]
MTEHTEYDATPSSGRALVLYPHAKTQVAKAQGGESQGAKSQGAKSQGAKSQGDQLARDPEARIEEAIGLARAIELEIVHGEWVPLRKPRPSTYLGQGVIERFGDLIEALEIEVAIIDTSLSPVQQRNLERAWKCKVIDRTALILEIFGARARTHEGRLQVELAALSFQRSRLVRSWTHLERQRGGLGFIGGPGESQIELDRRLIGDRITKIRRELETVTRTRELHRGARRRVPYPIVALVGYTNAGKSTLFNRLTKSNVVAQDLLFATLDPTMRKVELPSGRTIILSDTVGFISELPTHLVAAFRATLEEVLEADLILHVRDASHTESEVQKADVMTVLRDLELPEEKLDLGLLEVMNKIDLLEPGTTDGLTERGQIEQGRAAVSAITGEGCDALLALIDSKLGADRTPNDYGIALSDGAAIAWLYSHGDVVKREDDETHAHIQVRLDPADADRFVKRFASSLQTNVLTSVSATVN